MLNPVLPHSVAMTTAAPFFFSFSPKRCAKKKILYRLFPDETMVTDNCFFFPFFVSFFVRLARAATQTPWLSWIPFFCSCFFFLFFLFFCFFLFPPASLGKNNGGRGGQRCFIPNRVKSCGQRGQRDPISMATGRGGPPWCTGAGGKRNNKESQEKKKKRPLGAPLQNWVYCSLPRS